MRKSTGSYPSLTVDTTAKRVVAHAGAVLLTAAAGKIGLDRELSAALRSVARCFPDERGTVGDLRPVAVGHGAVGHRGMAAAAAASASDAASEEIDRGRGLTS